MLGNTWLCPTSRGYEPNFLGFCLHFLCSFLISSISRSFLLNQPIVLIGSTNCLFLLFWPHAYISHQFDQLFILLVWQITHVFIGSTNCSCFSSVWLIARVFIGSTNCLHFSSVCPIAHETGVRLLCCQFIQLLGRSVGWSSSNIFLKNSSCGQ